ncbi:hypothetical protein [Bifidobacterium sp. SO4]|uniref:hypothetical protein n=1 Tax=Bifidobacterium sp. SO4 TaxID=2809030 RepID=UPI001BDCD925|nr:hypothetical protein [Bifidobacterium sp. SO4]MBT1171746.1 hypothetical protein [Bifidobacterium sp. SO4]
MSINFPVPIDLDAMCGDSAPMRVEDVYVATEQDGSTPKRNRDGQIEYRVAVYFKRAGRRRGDLLEIKLFGSDPSSLIGHAVIPTSLELVPYTLQNGVSGNYLVADDFQIVDGAAAAAGAHAVKPAESDDEEPSF